MVTEMGRASSRASPEILFAPLPVAIGRNDVRILVTLGIFLLFLAGVALIVGKRPAATGASAGLALLGAMFIRTAVVHARRTGPGDIGAGAEKMVPLPQCEAATAFAREVCAPEWELIARIRKHERLLPPPPADRARIICIGPLVPPDSADWRFAPEVITPSRFLNHDWRFGVYALLLLGASFTPQTFCRS